jgi:microcin C transport system ATP-binding protein
MGSGKSVTALSILELLAVRRRRIASGQMLFKGRDLLHGRCRELARMRGDDIAMVFQEPMTSLNPLHTGRAADRRDRFALHKGMSGEAARRAHARTAAIASASRKAGSARLDLSAPALGRAAPARDDRHGAGQRADLLIADEPTTALDVTVQAQILKLLKKPAAAKLGMAMLFITHDLGIVAQRSPTASASMTKGEIVETGPVARGLRRAGARLIPASCWRQRRKADQVPVANRRADPSCRPTI